MSKPRYTRADLIEICERAIVPHDKWTDRDTPRSQTRVGEAWALLKAGCDFDVTYKPRYERDGCVTDDQTIWLEITHDDFGTFDWGGPQEVETFYLPTPKRIDAHEGRDWY